MDGIASLYQQYLNELQNPTVNSNILYGIPAITPRGKDDDPLTMPIDYSQGPLTNTQLSLLTAVNPMFGLIGYGQKLADQGSFDKFGRFGEGLRGLFESPAGKFSRLYDPSVSIFGGSDEDRMGIESYGTAEGESAAESMAADAEASAGYEDSEID
tara:strand:- start:41 stop:508 length:468 start_codon:yes stop_codon:yes gene_type:complete